MEARVGFEPTNNDFADRCLSPAGPPCRKIKDKRGLLRCPSVFTQSLWGLTANPLIGEVTFLHLPSRFREPASCYRTTVNY